MLRASLWEVLKTFPPTNRFARPMVAFEARIRASENRFD
jgi:hypothetical protein